MRTLLRLALTLLFALGMQAQVPSPQIPLTGTIGSGGVFPLLNSGTLIFASDANRTMAYPEMTASFIKVTSSVSLTATRNLVAPLTIGFSFTIENATTGGQSIQIIGASGTGVTIPNGSTYQVVSDGTNYVSAGGGGGSMVYPGAGIGNSTGSAWGTSYSDSNTIPGNFLTVFGASGSGHSQGAVPDPGATAGTTHYLREDGTWDVPPGSSSPLTTKGDLYGFDTADARIPVGTDGQVLTADSSQTLGLKWATPTPGGVTSFTGDGSLLTNSGSTGAVTATLANAAPHTFFGNNTGSSAAPGYEAIGTGDLPGSGATTVNGQTCTLGSSCTLPFTSYEFQAAAIAIGGSAFAAKLSYYSTCGPTVGLYNAAQSTAAYLQFDPYSACYKYAQGYTTLPVNWTHTDAYVTFTGTATTGNVTWEIQTSCVGTGNTAGSESWSSGVSVTTAFPGTEGQYVVTALFSDIAEAGVNSCPSSPTVPGQIAYRITRTDSTTGEAQLEGVTLSTARSE